MTLIKCPECSNAISDSAEICPHCGIKSSLIKAKKNEALRNEAKGKLKRLLITIVVVSGFMVWLYNGGPNFSMKAGTDPVIPFEKRNMIPRDEPSFYNQPSHQDPINISAIDLYRAYQTNEVKADMDYRGKVLAVSGTVKEIGIDFMGEPYVTLTLGSYDHIRAKFPKGGNENLAKLKPFDNVTLTCIGDGMVLNSPKLDCTK